MASGTALHWNVTLLPFGVAPMSCGFACEQLFAAATVKLRVSLKSGWQLAKRATTYHVAGPAGRPALALVEVVDAATAPLTKRSYAVAFCTALQEKATGLATEAALFAGARSDGGVVGHCGAGALTAVVTETALLARFGSGVDEETVALSVMLPADGGAVALMVMGVALPTGTDCALQLTTLPFAPQLQPVPPAPTKATPDGSVSETLTFCAVVGPALAMLTT